MDTFTGWSLIFEDKDLSSRSKISIKKHLDTLEENISRIFEFLKNKPNDQFKNGGSFFSLRVGPISSVFS